MEKSIQLIKQIESTHRGLGIPILFGNVAVLGKTSVMFVGEKAIGKGTTINNIKPINIPLKYNISMDTMTYQILQSRIGICHDTAMLWKMEEWSTLSKYHREVFMTIGAKVITDRKFYHESGTRKGVPVIIDIKNVDLICQIGIQPLKMNFLMTENDNWESLASDRFIKFAMINPLRTDTIKEKPHYDLPIRIQQEKLPITTTFPLLRKMMAKQVSEDRIKLFMVDLMNAYCTIEGYSKIDLKAESEFVKLFKLYLEIYPALTYSLDIEEQSHFAVGSMRMLAYISRHQGINMSDLANDFSVYRKRAESVTHQRYSEMILKHSELLEAKDFIKIVRNSPAQFYLSDRVNKYFEWYREISS